MHLPRLFYFGLAMLMAGAGLRAQTASREHVESALPSETSAPLLTASEVRPAPAELLLQQQAAQHALELGLPAVAVEIYRGLLAVPAGDRAALTLALATALLDDGRVDEAEQALQGIVAQRDAAWHLREGLIAAVRKHFDAAQAEIASVKPGQLGPADRGWFYFLQGQLADAAGDGKQAQALYDQAADVQKEGVGTGIDTLRANVELQNEKQRLLEAQADRDTSLFGLSKLLNLDPRQSLELGDSLSFFDTPQPEAEASIASALGERQEWKALVERLKAAGLEKKASQDARLPALNFNGNWAYEGSSSTTGIPTYTYQAGVSVPIFTGGRIRAETVKADLEIQKLQQQRDDLRNQIALDVKTALINLDSARNQVVVANLGVQLSKEEVDQARDRFKAGVANNIEVIQAQDSLARANDNQIAALYRFNQARADYARSIGQMEKVYSK
ncbi:MAG TPA: TolC family protein [Opitutaceae bacterium]|nr:TolC family protein [Opitutaceae bacterium]